MLSKQNDMNSSGYILMGTKSGQIHKVCRRNIRN